jgi:hypothetical protein
MRDGGGGAGLVFGHGDPRYPPSADTLSRPPAPVVVNTGLDRGPEASRIGEGGPTPACRRCPGAPRAGARPLVTFDRSPRRPSYNPTPQQLAGALKGLRKRYPFVKDFSSWNEANMNKKPELVARWWLALRTACPTCNVLATDLLDKANMIPWAQRFVTAAGRTPKIWGLHNYVDANTMSTKTTKLLLASVGGDVWLTETGGIVRRANKSKLVFPTGTARAAKVTRFIFSKLVKLSPRIQRVYLYHWDTGVGGGPTWDSGFVGPDGQARPALTVLQGVVARSAGHR